MPNSRKRPPARRPTKAQLAAQEARRRRNRRRRVVTIAGIAVAVVVLVAIGWATSRPKNQKATAISATADPAVTCTPDTRADEISAAGPHVKDEPRYAVDPPAGGDHLIDPAAPGIYDDGKAPSDGHIVHSLEHGYVAIWYHPGVGTADLAKLENLWKNHKQDILLVERPSLPAGTPVVATAWGHRLVCTGVDDFQVEQFVQAYNNRGPEQVPHTVLPEGRDPRT